MAMSRASDGKNLAPEKLGKPPKKRNSPKVRKNRGVIKKDLVKQSATVGIPQERIEHICRFVKQDEEQRLVYGIVYEPDVRDADDDFSDKGEILKAAHLFLAEFRTMKIQHLVPNSGVVIVESYIAPVEFEMNGEMVKLGTWVLVTKIFDEEIWKLVQSGELTGYSMGGFATREFEEDSDSRGGS